MQTIGTVVDADTSRRRLHVAINEHLWQVQLTVEVYSQGAAVLCLEQAGLTELLVYLREAQKQLRSLAAPPLTLPG